jgi:acetyltransferase-like isoleucine patch superfamily enzyme
MNSAAIIGHCNIGDYAAIGTNATLLPYVSVGSGAIVASGALVETDIPPAPDR